MGYSLYVVSAIIGNWMAESGLNPNVFEGHVSYTYEEMLSTSLSGGYGLGQWTTNSNVNRRIPLLEWLPDNGYNYYDGEGQALYLIEENSWTVHSGYTAYSSLSEFLNSDSTDLKELTVYYLKNWEIPADSGTSVQNTRYANAKIAYEYIQSYYDEDTTYYWEYTDTTAGYLSSSQRYNNMLAAWQLLGNGIITGSYTESKNGMPVWMMVKPFYKIAPYYKLRQRR